VALSGVSPRKHHPSPMLKYPGRAVTITRILSVIVVCTVTWLWLGQDIGPTPQIVFEFHNHQEPPPPAFVVNASCDNVKPAVKATKLSQTLFPISNPEKSDSWVGENNKMLRALFRCMELSNCGPNQKKVVILGSFHFLGAFWGWVGGENIWARSTVLLSVSLPCCYECRCIGTRYKLSVIWDTPIYTLNIWNKLFNSTT